MEQKNNATPPKISPSKASIGTFVGILIIILAFVVCLYWIYISMQKAVPNVNVTTKVKTNPVVNSANLNQEANVNANINVNEASANEAINENANVSKVTNNANTNYTL